MPSGVKGLLLPSEEHTSQVHQKVGLPPFILKGLRNRSEKEWLQRTAIEGPPSRLSLPSRH